jgi:hypothetical protein
MPDGRLTFCGGSTVRAAAADLQLVAMNCDLDLFRRDAGKFCLHDQRVFRLTEVEGWKPAAAFGTAPAVERRGSRERCPETIEFFAELAEWASESTTEGRL